uniref:Uncharacterized protein n=1 Tax=Rhizophora mucronata TaxID=61149 RepID=A0A2P2MCP5_RHIMU
MSSVSISMYLVVLPSISISISIYLAVLPFWSSLTFNVSVFCLSGQELFSVLDVTHSGYIFDASPLCGDNINKDNPSPTLKKRSR